MVWGAMLAAAVVAVTPLSLAAQKLTDPTMPLPETSRRMRELEPPATAGDGVTVPMFEVWRVGAPPEMLLGWYLRRLNRLSPVKDAVLDTADVRVGDTRPSMTFHLTFHTFEDECMDPVPAASTSSDGTHPCSRWRRGTMKRRILDNNRVGYEQQLWIETITFLWYDREAASGAIVRRQIELRDTGLSDDWKRYNLVTQITLEREVLHPATP